MNDQKQQILEKLQNANNILVAMPASPSVDHLSAAIGMTLLLNKMNKHAITVFSGQVPKVLNFLKPDEAIEKDTDSLRDFIIALDKSKADKLRYKVEDEVVKIFITPYKASISDKDLVFSQGDFNVDVVLALGVLRQQDLDTAITAHGRILHDAVVISVNITPGGELGTINWQDEHASGLSELVASLAIDLGKELLDAPIATALLTGVVEETNHFSNQKTTPQTMTVSAALLAAGADQQLVARELGHGEAQMPANAPQKSVAAPQAAPAPNKDGELKVGHSGKKKKQITPPSEKASSNDGDTRTADTAELSTPAPVAVTDDSDSVESILKKEAAMDGENDSDAADNKTDHKPADNLESDDEKSSVISLPEPVESPFESLDSEPEDKSVPKTTPDNAVDGDMPSLSSDDDQPKADNPIITPPPAGTGPDVSNAAPAEPAKQDSLADLEASVGASAPDVATPPGPDATAPVDTGNVDSARKAVEDALKGSPDSAEESLQALNAVNVNLDLGHDEPHVEDPVAPKPQIISPGGPAPLTPPQADGSFGMPPAGQPLPHNPAANEPAPLATSPADQPFTMPLPPSGGPGAPMGGPAAPLGGPSAPFGSTSSPLSGAAPSMGGLNIPPPPSMPPTSTTMPPQGPPPPPVPPPVVPGSGPRP